jgi:hypothetical protein
VRLFNGAINHGAPYGNIELTFGLV